jgi:hypothetical protein
VVTNGVLCAAAFSTETLPCAFHRVSKAGESSLQSAVDVCEGAWEWFEEGTGGMLARGGSERLRCAAHVTDFRCLGETLCDLNVREAVSSGPLACNIDAINSWLFTSETWSSSCFDRS